MLKDDKANLEDCLAAISRIEDYTEDIKDRKELLNDSKTYDAVLMNFIVIAEAVNRLPLELKNKNNHVNWAGVRQFRNYLAHDYFGVDVREVWETIQSDLPKLKKDLAVILSDMN